MSQPYPPPPPPPAPPAYPPPPRPPLQTRTKLGYVLLVAAVLAYGVYYTRHDLTREPSSPSSPPGGITAPVRPGGIIGSGPDGPPPGAVTYPGTAAIPSWVPIYPGTTPAEIERNQTSDYESSTKFKLVPPSGMCDDFLDFYERELNLKGFRITNRHTSPLFGGACAGAMSGERNRAAQSVAIDAYAGDSNGRRIYVTITERNRHNPNDGGPGQSLPAWVPVYPGTSPENISGTNGGGVRDMTYSFSSPGGKNVLSWFDERLAALGFVNSTDLNALKGGYVHAHTADGKRMFNIDSAAPGSAPVFFVTLRDQQ